MWVSVERGCGIVVFSPAVVFSTFREERSNRRRWHNSCEEQAELGGALKTLEPAAKHVFANSSRRSSKRMASKTQRWNVFHWLRVPSRACAPRKTDADCVVVGLSGTKKEGEKKQDPTSLLYSQPETGRSKLRLSCERKDGPQRNTRTSPKPRPTTHGEVDHDRAVRDLARGRPHLRLQQKRQPQGPRPTLFVARQEHSSVHRDPDQLRSTGASILQLRRPNYEFLQMRRLHRTLALDRELHATKQHDHSWGESMLITKNRTRTELNRGAEIRMRKNSR